VSGAARLVGRGPVSPRSGRLGAAIPGLAPFGADEEFDARGRDQHLPDFVLEHPVGVGDPLAQVHELEP